jgi:hypothetical protein
VELTLTVSVTAPETVPAAGLVNVTIGAAGCVPPETVTEIAEDVVCCPSKSVAIAVRV